MAHMTSPPTGVKIRMYRQGHGDCFLLAFAGREGRRKRNVYVLIDCGLKPGSEIRDQKIDAVIEDIRKATNGRIDVVIVTHEHQDHVNGFAKTENGTPLFDGIEIGEVWLAWTEDGTDSVANALRDRFRDTLVTLAFAAQGLQAQAQAGSGAALDRLAELIDTEAGDGGALPDGAAETIRNAFSAAKGANPLAARAELAAAAIEGISNKTAIKYLRDRSEAPVRFLRPDRDPEALPHVRDLRVFALGPPRNEALLLDLDPRENEEFHLAAAGSGMAFDSAARSLALAVAPEMAGRRGPSPLPGRHLIPETDVLDRPWTPAPEPLSASSDPACTPAVSPEDEKRDWLRRVYGGRTRPPGSVPPVPVTADEISDHEVAWRRVDSDWTGAAEALALRLNDEVNNTSLVLAFELPKTGKVLLFTGDAQRGSWIGWSKLEWTEGDCSKVTARDLLSRCVFYKVGHHGSHNATLNGTEADDYANLGWLGRGSFARDFVAMIPANTGWATSKSRPWIHPLPEIERALKEKARGRVFRSDVDAVPRPDPSVMSDAEWADFQNRIEEEDLYFDYRIEDK